MSWKIIRNGEPDFLNTPYTGICPRFGEKATVTVFYRGSKICKTDLQKTYCKSGIKCSLLDGTNVASFSPCMDTCPLVPDKY